MKFEVGQRFVPIDDSWYSFVIFRIDYAGIHQRIIKEKGEKYFICSARQLSKDVSGFYRLDTPSYLKSVRSKVKKSKKK